MIHTIENERFRISARTCGAELCAFTEKTAAGDYEHLWEGDPAVWSGRSPLLFPIVGRLREDTYVLNGSEYHMPKHGFAKKMEFVPEVLTEDRMVFLLTDTQKTREGFPYAFALRVIYTFVENGFCMEFDVTNPNDAVMYFSIGAHPAFRISLGDKVVLDENQTLAAYRLDENFLRAKQQIPVFDDSRTLVVTEHLFDSDALIFDGVTAPGASVVRADGHHVHVDFGGAPCLGIWAKPAAPYVCIEPWYGIDDICDAGHDITRKERIIALGAGETFRFPVTVTSFS
ncbi:MAG: aldose 1-epimerase family protein [Eubacteriales bacterium]